MAKSTWFKQKPSVAKNVEKVNNGANPHPPHATNRNKKQAGAEKNHTRKWQKIKHQNFQPKTEQKGSSKTSPITTVLFIEQTRGGELLRRLREAEEWLSKLTGWRVKIVEKGGTTIKQQLVRSNPWAKSRCEREDCMACNKGDSEQDCYRRNILYENTCMLCLKKEQPAERVYVGESSRTMYERGAEHYDDLKKKRADSHMWKHWEIDHAGEEQEPQFKLKVVKTFQSSLDRQIAEAVRIRRRGAGILNSKGVYNRCTLPRLVVEERKTDMVEEQETCYQELPEEEWTRPGWMSRRKRDEEEERADRPSKRSRTEWGVGEIAGEQQRIDFLLSRNNEAKGAKMKQTKLKPMREGEVVARWIVRGIVERINLEVQMGKNDNKDLNYAYTVYESQVQAILTEMIEESVKKSNREKELNTNTAQGRNMLSNWVTRSRKVSVKSNINCQPNQNPNGLQPLKTDKTRRKQREVQLGARQLVRQLADQAVERIENSTLNTQPTTPEKVTKASSYFSIFSKKKAKPFIQAQPNQIQNQSFLKPKGKIIQNKLTKYQGRSSQSKFTQSIGVAPSKRKRESSPDKQTKKKRSKLKVGESNQLITSFFNNSLGREERAYIKSISSTGLCPFSVVQSSEQEALLRN